MKRYLMVLVAMIAMTAVLAAGAAWGQATPATPSAGEYDLEKQPLNHLGVGLFFQDVVALTPGTGGFIGPVSGAVMGVAFTYQRRLSSESGWFLDAGAGDGWGREANEVVQPIAFTKRTSFSAQYGRAGMGYEVRITDKASAFASAGVFYSATRARFDNGGSAVDGARFKTWGLDQALGLRVAVGGAVALHGELVASHGWGSGKGPDAAYRATVKSGAARGGVLFGF
jgi:hypothetical protein